MSFKKEELEEIKKRLLCLRSQLTNNIQGTSLEVKDKDKIIGLSKSQTDEGTDDFVQNINLGVSNNEMQVIRYIDRSLEKIEEGTYGICDVTEEEIPRKRLEALPYATMTVQAQEKREKGLA